jgi:integrase
MMQPPLDITSEPINHRPLAPSLHAAHCLRHTMRDRLRAVECPMDMIDQIGGWRSVGGVGARYGEGYGLEPVREVMEIIK